MCLLAITYIMMAIGPICGFILGAGLLTQYVNPFQAVQRIISTDADWIGFWWGGFVICGVLYLLSSIPFLWFPRQVAKSQEILTNSKNNNSNDKSTYGRSWKSKNNSVVSTVDNYSALAVCYSTVHAFSCRSTSLTLNCTFVNGRYSPLLQSGNRANVSETFLQKYQFQFFDWQRTVFILLQR